MQGRQREQAVHAAGRLAAEIQVRETYPVRALIPPPPLHDGGDSYLWETGSLGCASEVVGTLTVQEAGVDRGVGDLRNHRCASVTHAQLGLQIDQNNRKEERGYPVSKKEKQKDNGEG